MACINTYKPSPVMVGWLHWLYQTNFIQFRRSAPPRHTAIICRPQRAKPNLWTLPSQRSRETTTEAVRETVPRHVPWPRKSDSSKILRCKKKTSIPDFEWMNQRDPKGLGKTKHRHSQESRPEDLKGVTSRYPMDLWCSACHQPSNCWSRHLADVGFAHESWNPEWYW